MKIKYFSDTDTALVEFSGRKVAETKEINENIYIDLDASGNLVAMTIELLHAFWLSPFHLLCPRFLIFWGFYAPCLMFFPLAPSRLAPYSFSILS